MFSAQGIREGRVFDMLDDRAKSEDPLIVASEDVASRESRFAGVGDAMFDWVAPLFPDESATENRLRRAACLLGDIGWHEHPDYRAEQVYFRILRLPLLGVTHVDRTRIALAVYRRYGGRMNDQALRTAEALLSESDIQWSRRLGGRPASGRNPDSRQCTAARWGRAQAFGRDPHPEAEGWQCGPGR